MLITRNRANWKWNYSSEINQLHQYGYDMNSRWVAHLEGNKSSKIKRPHTHTHFPGKAFEWSPLHNTLVPVPPAEPTPQQVGTPWVWHANGTFTDPLAREDTIKDRQLIPFHFHSVPECCLFRVASLNWRISLMEYPVTKGIGVGRARSINILHTFYARVGQHAQCRSQAML